jgi:very-short-patch-repair endonuclease
MESSYFKKQTGERFLRQLPIDNFIVDFFAPDLGLIIEIAGSSDINKVEYDFNLTSDLIDFLKVKYFIKAQK